VDRPVRPPATSLIGWIDHLGRHLPAPLAQLQPRGGERQ
jgi:hypothetical protein